MKKHGDHKIFLGKKYDNAGQCRTFWGVLQNINTLKNKRYWEKRINAGRTTRILVVRDAGQSRTLVKCDTTKDVKSLVLNRWWYTKIFSYEYIVPIWTKIAEITVNYETVSLPCFN